MGEVSRQPVAGHVGLRRRVAGSAVLLLAVVAACGDDGGDTAAGDRETNAYGERVTPLSEFMGWDEPGDFDTDEARRLDEQAEALIVTCMRNEGFDYVAYVYDYDDVDMTAEAWLENSPWADPEEFAATYGYGLTTDEMLDEFWEDGWDPSDDPNYEIREGLSEAEQEAYDIALDGDWSAFDDLAVVLDDDSDAEGPPMPDDTGCRGEAYDEVYGWDDDGGDDSFAAFDDLFEEMDALWGRTDTDERVIAVVAEWADCMADAGYPGLQEIWDGYELVEAYVEENDVVVPGLFMDAEFREDAAALGEAGETEPVDPEALADAQAYEIAVAVADYECTVATDLEDVRHDVQVELEDEFIDANRAELERYRDTIESSSFGGAQG